MSSVGKILEEKIDEIVGLIERQAQKAKDIPEWASRLKDTIEKDGHLETLIIYCNSPPEMDNSGYSDLKLIS